MLTILLVVLGSGGVNSDVLPWVTLPVIMAVSIFSARVAALWLLSALILIGLFFGLHILDVPVLGNTSDEYKIYFRILSLFSLVIVTFFTCWPGLRARENALTKARQELVHRNAIEIELRRTSILAQEASHAKSVFLANMSHELRTPMNGVLGTLDLLRMTSLSSEQKGLLETSSSSARMLLHIINDILDLSRIESGELEIELVPFDPIDLIRRVVDLHLKCAQDKGLKLEFKWPSESVIMIKSDPNRVSQILGNLLSNAVKFTSEGGIKVLAEFIPAHDKTTRMVVRVIDTGIGISLAEQQRVFSLFEQVDGSVTRKYGGTGLGLTISRKLAHMLGGDIRVQSESAKGSEFIMDVQVEQCEPYKAVGTPASSVTIPSGFRVLVVEDNPVNQMVVTRMLRRMKIDVEVAENGQIALDLIQRESFNLVFMDVQMPVLDGIRTIRKIREREAEESKERLLVVALTANAMKGDREKCIEAGMDDYLSKPLQLKELTRILGKWVTA